MKVKDVLNYIKNEREDYLPSVAEGILLCDIVDMKLFYEILCGRYDNAGNPVGNHIDSCGEYISITTEDNELFAPRQYRDLYVSYILAEVEKRKSESTRYANDMIAFNEQLQAYGAYISRTYTKSQNNLRWY